MNKTLNIINSPAFKKLYEESKMQYFTSHYSFLNNINGFRSKLFHLLLGTSGSGKSTFCKSIAIDFLENNRFFNVLIYLSEETVEQYLCDFMTSCKENHEILENLNVVSEQQEAIVSIRNIEEKLDESKADLFIFDNITTSNFYLDKKPQEQAEFAKELKKLAANKGIPFLIVAHTTSSTKDNQNLVIDQNDIRGSKSITNFSEFIFIIQKFTAGEVYYPTIRIAKHRTVNPSNILFRLRFCKQKRLYTEDKAIDFEEFKEIFKNRDKL